MQGGGAEIHVVVDLFFGKVTDCRWLLCFVVVVNVVLKKEKAKTWTLSRKGNEI